MMQFLLDNHPILFVGANMVVACTNLLYLPISWKKKLLLYCILLPFDFFINICSVSVGAFLGHLSTPIIIFVILLYLALIHSFSAVNLCCSLTGYIWSVCLNNLELAFLGLFGITVSVIATDYSFPFCLTHFLLLHLSTYYAGSYFRKHVTLTPTESTRKIVPLLAFFLTICTIIFILNITWGQIIGYPPDAIAFNSLLFLLFFALTSVVLFSLTRILRKEQEQAVRLLAYQNLQEYTEKMEELYQDTRWFKHGYINILSSLYSYIEESGYQPLQTYFREKILPTQKVLEETDQQLGYLSFLETPELKGFLYTKLTYALHRDIQVIIDIHETIPAVNVDLLDLIQVLGIYIDNAIEAALMTPQKELYLGMTRFEERTLIVVENSCIEDSVNLDMLYQEGYSTKGTKRGIGLAESTRTLAHHSNIFHAAQCENHRFRQQLEILPGKD